MRQVANGLEKLLGSSAGLVRGRRVGLVAHPASVGPDLRHALDLLVEAEAGVVRLFGPEHGFGGEAQDMEPVDGVSRGPMGIELVSLYGAQESTLSPPPGSLDDLDVIVADLADVGSRYYTFVWTALLTLRSCAAAGVEMILTDRPNPLCGERVEGPVQRPGFLSFVGLAPLPVRHGLTPGEVVGLFARREGIADALRVVPMDGWKRGMYFDDTGLPWVMPSPNMPTLDTAVVYPGMCLLEATWASEGRGTTRPFELFGAPGIDPTALAKAMERHGLRGVRFRPTSFKPTFQKHAGVPCGGVQIHVTDRDELRPYRLGLAALSALRELGEERFEWRADPYEFVSDIPAIDLLTGSPDVRAAIERGAAPDELDELSRDAGVDELAEHHLYGG